jgi:hypothetical protein
MGVYIVILGTERFATIFVDQIEFKNVRHQTKISVPTALVG